MRVLESFARGKRSDQNLNEDALYVNEHFALLADGATDISGSTLNGLTSGRFAAMAVVEAVKSLPCDTPAFEAVEHITERFKSALSTFDAPQARPPSAAILLYSRHHKEVWRVGDGHLRLDDTVHLGVKLIDDVTTHWRHAWTHALLASGESVESLLEHDPGFKAIWPLVELQGAFANHETSPYSFGVIDGTPVPRKHIEVFDCSGVTKVVLTSDGFLAPEPTLEASLELNEVNRTQDPLALSSLSISRATNPQWYNFDDQSYISLLT